MKHKIPKGPWEHFDARGREVPSAPPTPEINTSYQFSDLNEYETGQPSE